MEHMVSDWQPVILGSMLLLNLIADQIWIGYVASAKEKEHKNGNRY